MPAAFRIYRSLEETGHDFGPCALTIGNFDGVHSGHRQILRRVVALARERGWKPSVLTFHPHPASIVAPERAPQLLTTPGARALLMKDQGVEQVLILPFTRELSLVEPEAFIRDIVAGPLDACAVLVGDNFRFGHLHSGDTRLLAALGRKYGFLTEAVPAIRMRGRVVSSSEVRRLIHGGKVSLACRLLGRPYAIEGPVVPGHGIGSRQTVPTLNVQVRDSLLPATGVYVTRTLDPEDRRAWRSVTNVGYRPTFDGSGLWVECFLLEPPAGASPRSLRVEFLLRLREERKFPDAASLKAQILKDAARAAEYFRRTKAPGGTVV